MGKKKVNNITGRKSKQGRLYTTGSNGLVKSNTAAECCEALREAIFFIASADFNCPVLVPVGAGGGVDLGLTAKLGFPRGQQ